MGIGGISIWQLLIIFAIILVVFGTKRLRNVGGDLGAALKNFRQATQADRATPPSEKASEIEVDKMTEVDKTEDKASS